MASSSSSFTSFTLTFFAYFLFLSSTRTCHAQISDPPRHQPHSPVAKDPATLHYLTNIRIGTSLEPISVVLDLAGPSLWLDCSSPISGSLRSIPTRSIQCLTAHNSNSDSNSDRCHVSVENAITRSTAAARLSESSLTLGSAATVVDPFLFSCAPASLLRGLPAGARGMLGLGRTRISLPSQLHRRFALCLSSDRRGALVATEKSPPLPKSLLQYTPLVAQPQQPGYFITVNSIKINGKRVSLGGASPLRAEISTVVPYTKMVTPMWVNFVAAFERGSGANMTRVAPVYPFELCYDNHMSVPVPEIELVLQSSVVKWRVGGRNSMVRVSDEKVCLGFVDGGSEMETPLVIGGYQLEDVLLHFDLGTSVLGFSSSLLDAGTSCSRLSSESDSMSEQSS